MRLATATPRAACKALLLGLRLLFTGACAVVIDLLGASSGPSLSCRVSAAAFKLSRGLMRLGCLSGTSTPKSPPSLPLAWPPSLPFSLGETSGEGVLLGSGAGDSAGDKVRDRAGDGDGAGAGSGNRDGEVEDIQIGGW